MSGIFSPPTRRAHTIAEQERGLDRIDQIAEHARFTHLILEEMKEALEAADPQIKFEQATLDPNQEVIVRYETGRYRYAIYTTETAGTKINVALMTGATFQLQTAAPGWLGLDYPAGTRLYSGDNSRHVILVRMSNLKV